MNPQATFIYAVLLPHPTTSHLLLIATPAGYALPQWQTSTPPFWQNTAYINATIATTYGITATTLRCVTLLDDDAKQIYTRVYELEQHAVDRPLPAASRWISAAELPTLSLAQPEHRALISAWFAETANGRPPQRRAWARPGWFASASRWISETLAAHNKPAFEQLEQLRSWERSCVLRASSADQTWYFKALPPNFAHELGLIAALREHHAANSVDLLASEPTQHWLLMPDLAAPTLDTLDQPAAWHAAAEELARLQIATIAQTEQLLALGCLDLRPEQIAAAIDPFFAVLERYPYVAPTTIAAVRQRAPEFKTICAELACGPIPMALEHGDLGPFNIMVRDGCPIFFDWSDASLTHPFFVLVLLLAALPPAISTNPTERDAFITSYLAPWTVFAPIAEVRRVWTLAAQIAPLHHALIYHLRILPALEAKWEMISMVAFYLHMLG